MDANQAEMEVKMDSQHEKLMAIMKACKEVIEAMQEACLEKPESWYSMGIGL
jgi:hypothetical protein